MQAHTLSHLHRAAGIFEAWRSSQCRQLCSCYAIRWQEAVSGPGSRWRWRLLRPYDCWSEPWIVSTPGGFTGTPNLQLEVAASTLKRGLYRTGARYSPLSMRINIAALRHWKRKAQTQRLKQPEPEYGSQADPAPAARGDPVSLKPEIQHQLELASEELEVEVQLELQHPPDHASDYWRCQWQVASAAGSATGTSQHCQWHWQWCCQCHWQWQAQRPQPDSEAGSASELQLASELQIELEVSCQ